MNKPRIFLGSSGKQAKLLESISDGLGDIADVETWMTTFNPGRNTLDRLVELSEEVDFAAFVFAQDDWTSTDTAQPGQASPRDNVVFEAGLFGGALGIRRTFILHAHGSKLPTDLLGLTSVRYEPSITPAEVRGITEKLRKAIETEGHRGPIEGLWWQLSLTVRSDDEPTAVGLLSIGRDRDGALDRDRAGLAGGRHPVRPLLERGHERPQGPTWHLLLLAGRATPPPERPTAGGHRGDQIGDHRPRHRLLVDPVRSRRQPACPNFWHLSAR